MAKPPLLFASWVFLWLFACPAFAGRQDEVVAWFRERAQPLAKDDPGAPHGDLRFLDEALAGKRAVLLGEEVHGVREFSRLKHRLIRYLAEEHGFRTLAFEQDSLRGEAFDRYLATGLGDPRGTLQTCYWSWNHRAVVELLQWMRGWNERAGSADPPRPRLGFVGIDNQSFGGAGQRLRHHVEGPGSDGPDLRDLVDACLAPFQLGRDAFQATGEEERAQHASDLRELRAALRDDGADPALLDAARVLLEVHELWSAPHSLARMNVRDRHMGQRVRERLADPRERLVVWAHNAHVSRADFYGQVRPLGSHLSEAEDCLVVGFYFGRGEFLLDPRARTDGPTRRLATCVPDSLGSVLAEVREGMWAVDLREAPEDPVVRRFLEAPPAGHFDNYGPAPAILGAIDVLVFVDVVTPPRDVEGD